MEFRRMKFKDTLEMNDQDDQRSAHLSHANA